MSGELHIERLGGLAGMGLPASHLRSEGRLAADALSDADRAAVDRLFARPPATRSAASPVRDGFRYRITRTSATGVPEMVELAAESQVPQALLDCIQDTLR
ncbi:protealysin inhibitor emfourin [Sphaerotilus sp.]|uniref:protealysin inhibitor emfourin n=1 Tax=Sphaerotilus sp. TaxID=2093942 RepID=UPI0034E1DCA3